MVRDSSPLTVAVAVAALGAILLVGYGTLYWWRLRSNSYVGWNDDEAAWRVDFHNPIEDTLFPPIAAFHQRVHRESFYLGLFPNDSAVRLVMRESERMARLPSAPIEGRCGTYGW